MTQAVGVVVGAGPGLGLAIAERFAREGFRMALIARRADALAAYAEQLGSGAVGYATDASDPEALRETIERIGAEMGAPGVLVYNAASFREGAPSSISPDQFMGDFRLNVVGALVAAQAVIPAMRAAAQTGSTGTILFTGGGAAFNPSVRFAGLSIGKAALRSLALSMAQELEPDGVHVATVTIFGGIGSNDHLAPERIAEAYWRLHTQPRGAWEREVEYR